MSLADGVGGDNISRWRALRSAVWSHVGVHSGKVAQGLPHAAVPHLGLDHQSSEDTQSELGSSHQRSLPSARHDAGNEGLHESVAAAGLASVRPCHSEWFLNYCSRHKTCVALQTALYGIYECLRMIEWMMVMNGVCACKLNKVGAVLFASLLQSLGTWWLPLQPVVAKRSTSDKAQDLKALHGQEAVNVEGEHEVLGSSVSEWHGMSLEGGGIGLQDEQVPIDKRIVDRMVGLAGKSIRCEHPI